MWIFADIFPKMKEVSLSIQGKELKMFAAALAGQPGCLERCPRTPQWYGVSPSQGRYQ